MQVAWTAAAALALCLVCAPVGAQGLVDAARRAEDSRKASTKTPITFDERDVNPLLAAREVLEYPIDEKRWPTFVAADNRVMDVMEKDLALYGRLELLRARNGRMIERFLLREPTLMKALQASGTDAREYAYISLAIGVAIAIIANDPGPEILEQLPDATKGNLAFVKAHDEEIKKLLARGARVKARAEKAAAAPASPAEKADAAKGTTPSTPKWSAFEVDEARWARLVAADKLVIEAVEKEPRLFAEMKKLNLLEEDPDDAVQALERFVAGEPALAAAVKAAGSTAQEYAYTQMAITVAATLLAADPPPSPAIMENAPRAVKANFAFVRAHQREVDEQHARSVAFQQRMDKK
jgi:hypothetical protein